MKNRSLYLALVLTALLLVFGVWLFVFFQSSLTTRQVAAKPEKGKAAVFSPADQPFYNPPRPEDAPKSIRAEVMLGYKIMTETQKYAGQYINSKLSCTSCHFDGGRSLKSISLVGVGAKYPLFRKRREYTADLTLRTQGCFERSMNGTAPAWNSQVMQSILVYLQWISKDIPIYSDIPWGLPYDLGNAHKPVVADGEKVYKDVCARCHGENGEGTPIAPPLWGDGSYNDGAGMHRIRTLSVFAWRYMPKDAPSLSQEQALDVAAFVHEKPRPKFVATHSNAVVREIPLPEVK